VPVRASDEASLLTDVYLAGARESLPVILIRTPYGRRGAYGTMGRLFAERGYHAVIQSTRGTSGSGGQIDYDTEAGDGRATADWIIQQPWSNGEIGTFGGSYLTFTQLALASTRPPQLKAMALGVWGAERRALYYPGGAFSLDRLSWAFVIENQERPLAFVRTPLRARRALASAFAHLPTSSAPATGSGSRSPAAPTPATHGTPAAENHWRQRQPSARHSRASTTTPHTPQRSSCQSYPGDGKAPTWAGTLIDRDSGRRQMQRTGISAETDVLQRCLGVDPRLCSMVFFRRHASMI
jgi:predicted acyl esterase